MSALIWDKDDERFYRTGVDKVALYVMSGGTYGTGAAWSGVSSINETPGGAESNKVYADNIEYLNLISNETAEGTITCYDYPDEFAQCDGVLSPVSGINFGQQPRKAFGVAFRTRIGNNEDGSSHAYEIHLWYNCKSTPSEQTYSSEAESPEANEMSFSISMTKTNVGKIGNVEYKPLAWIKIDSRKFTTENQKAALKTLEDTLWGRDADDTATPPVTAIEPTLPSPAQVVTMLTVANG